MSLPLSSYTECDRGAVAMVANCVIGTQGERLSRHRSQCWCCLKWQKRKRKRAWKKNFSLSLINLSPFRSLSQYWASKCFFSFFFRTPTHHSPRCPHIQYCLCIFPTDSPSHIDMFRSWTHAYCCLLLQVLPSPLVDPHCRLLCFQLTIRFSWLTTWTQIGWHCVPLRFLEFRSRALTTLFHLSGFF